MLFLLAAGLTTGVFTTAKFLTALLLFIMSTFAFDNGDINYGFFGLLFALLISPLSPLDLPRHIWVLFDIFLIVGVTYYIQRSTNPFKKGVRFEEHVATLFPKERFDIVSRTSDRSKSTGRRVESDSNPDFIFRSKATTNEFGIECKWRAQWYKKNGKYGMYWDLKQQNAYLKFSQKNSMPVYIAFGIGGKPEKPKEVHFIEVTKTIYPFLWKELITSGVKIGEI